MRSLSRQIEGCGYRLLNVILVELIAITLLSPVHPGGIIKGLLESLIDAALGQMTLHVGDVGMVATETLMLVEHP